MRVLLIMLLISFSGLTACDNLFESNRNKTIFNNLRLIHYALDFPRSDESLERCKKYHDKACLENFALAKSAKRQLFSVSHQEALTLTLHTIEKECAMPEIDIENLCPGAITAIGFFLSEEDDKKLIAFLTNTEGLVVQRVFDMNGEWLYFRKNKSIWKNWVNNSSLDAGTKRGIINILNAKPPTERTLDILSKT